MEEKAFRLDLTAQEIDTILKSLKLAQWNCGDSGTWQIDGMHGKCRDLINKLTIVYSMERKDESGI